MQFNMEENRTVKSEWVCTHSRITSILRMGDLRSTPTSASDCTEKSKYKISSFMSVRPMKDQHQQSDSNLGGTKSEFCCELNKSVSMNSALLLFPGNMHHLKNIFLNNGVIINKKLYILLEDVQRLGFLDKRRVKSV